MTEWWDQQIERVDHLVPRANGSKELLKFHAFLLRAQKDVYEFLCCCKEWLPSGDLDREQDARERLPEDRIP